MAENLLPFPEPLENDLVSTAAPSAEAEEPPQAKAEKALSEIERDKKKDPLPLIEIIAAIEDPGRHALLTGRLAALRIPGVNLRFINQRVHAHRAAAEAARKNAADTARHGDLLALKVNGADLVGELEDFFSKRCWLPEFAALVESLFTILTYCADQFTTVPYLCVESGTPGCGKSTNFDLCAAVVARPLLSVGLTRSVLFRQLDERKVTLLLDESEWLSSQSEAAEAIKGILHAGYRKGATYQIMEGDKHKQMRSFEVFGPKAFSAIRGLKGALLDRCIVIHMERLPEGQTLLPAGIDDLEPVAVALRERLEAFALQIILQLEDLRRNRPLGGYWSEFRNREAELWHPLLTIARVCGPDVEARALKAARALSRAKQLIQADERQNAQGRELVEVLELMECVRFRPVELVSRLQVSEAWAETLAEKKDERAKAATIGRFLNGFRIRSHRRSRTGSTYDRLETIEVVGRHVPTILPETPATTATPATNPEEPAGSDVANRSAAPQRDLQQYSTTVPGLADGNSELLHESDSNPGSCGSVTDVADNPGTQEEL